MAYAAELTEGALVLEGGGMRGAFTTGVLDFFLEKNIVFDRVYGVSAGACHACSYLSLQPGRAHRIVADYVNDPRYMSYSNLLKGDDFFSREFVYHTIPDELDLYDYDMLREYPGKFYVAVTDCKTGKPVYFPVEELHRDIDKVRASASLPILSHMVKIDGGEYLDGGMCDSIPVKKAVADGAKKCVVVLTRDTDYRKEPSSSYRLAKLFHPSYKKLAHVMKYRHLMYNEAVEYVQQQDNAGEIFVLRPLKERLDVERLERDPEKLRRLHDHGYDVAAENYDRLLEYLNK